MIVASVGGIFIDIEGIEPLGLGGNINSFGGGELELEAAAG
jgi:hypothetical protein